MNQPQNVAGEESALAAMLADHPYHCSESNYYSHESGASWETMTDFLAEFENADIDMNLVFRWDVRQRDPDNPGRCYAEVFMMHQRKGLFSPHHIKHVDESEAVRFREYLKKHWATMRKLWRPLSDDSMQINEKLVAKVIEQMKTRANCHLNAAKQTPNRKKAAAHELAASDLLNLVYDLTNATDNQESDGAS